MAPPFRVALFDMLYGEGISKIGEMLDYGVEHGFVKKSGAWYSIASEESLRETANPSMSSQPCNHEQSEGEGEAELQDECTNDGDAEQEEADDDIEVKMKEGITICINFFSSSFFF